MTRWTHRAAPIAAALLCGAPLAHADTLTELRATLERLSGKAALSAQVQVQGETRQGGDATPVSGTLQVDDGPGGLRLTYPSEVMTRLLAQQAAAAATASDRNPPRDDARATLSELDPLALRPLLQAAPSLLTLLQRASCEPEQAGKLNGQPARQLRCTLPRPAMRERERDYVKQYDGKLELWLAADGTPLAAKRTETFSGRAFVVVTFDNQSSDELTYAVVADRLVATRRVRRQSGTGAGERGESQLTWTLKPK